MASSDSDGSDFASIGQTKVAHVQKKPVVEKTASLVTGISGISSQRTTLEHHYVCGKARAEHSKKAAERRELRLTNLGMSIAQSSGRRGSRIVTDVRSQEESVGRKHSPSYILGKVACALEQRKNARPKLMPSEDLSCAFHPSIRIRDISRDLGISLSTVVEKKLAVAGVLSGMLIEYLWAWQKVHKEAQPLAVLHGHKYDSATFFIRNEVVLPGLGKLKSEQSARPVHSLVCKRFLIAVYETEIIEMHYPSTSVDITDTGCGALKTALEDAPSSKPQQDVAEAWMRTAEILALEADCFDGAYPNLKYQAHSELNPGPDNFQRDSTWCGNHSTKISETVLDTIGDERAAIRKLTNTITLLRTNGFFIRVLSVLLPVILDGLVLFDDPVPAGAHEKAHVLRRHALFHYKRFKHGHSSKGSATGLRFFCLLNASGRQGLYPSTSSNDFLFLSMA